jgi:hypothetical protein
MVGVPQRMEITFEEIHRNDISFGDITTTDTRVTTVISLKRFEVLIVARFWHQRANFFDQENQYDSRVTGPNEYENNVNNNFTPIIQMVFRVYL